MMDQRAELVRQRTYILRETRAFNAGRREEPPPDGWPRRLAQIEQALHPRRKRIATY